METHKIPQPTRTWIANENPHVIKVFNFWNWLKFHGNRGNSYASGRNYF